ncbi:MAG: hypothetical protein K2Y56_16820, partial [Methylobacterium sp.]|uniref:hypothetical protein n=1 Tax=Methylobacterium sp. TaxID=409 RepID=UPI0025E61733
AETVRHSENPCRAASRARSRSSLVALDAGRVRVRTLTLPDLYQDHDRPDAMYKAAGLDADSIVKTVQDTLPERKAGRLRLA